MKAPARALLPALAVALVVAAAACAFADPPPAVLGPAKWQLTVSPQEPAAGIPAEVTLQQFGPDGKRRPYGLVMPVPVVRALDLTTGREVTAIPRAIDHRGAWLFDLVFPTPGRWQIGFNPTPRTTFTDASAEPLRWPMPPAAAPTVVRDAVGDANLSLVVTVIPDRGPILWFLRTRMLEVTGVIVILIASVASYTFQQRRARAAASRS